MADIAFVQLYRTYFLLYKNVKKERDRRKIRRVCVGCQEENDVITRMSFHELSSVLCLAFDLCGI